MTSELQSLVGSIKKSIKIKSRDLSTEWKLTGKKSFTKVRRVSARDHALICRRIVYAWNDHDSHNVLSNVVYRLHWTVVKMALYGMMK